MWSLAIAAATVTALAVGRHRPAAGWAAHLALQALWAGYAIATRQWGFLVCAGAWTLTYGRLLAAAVRPGPERLPDVDELGDGAGGEDVGGRPQR